jgi:hypothetical protein
VAGIGPDTRAIGRHEVHNTVVLQRHYTTGRHNRDCNPYISVRKCPKATALVVSLCGGRVFGAAVYRVTIGPT